jgi:uncharacterized metal-binding protein YceD (DUF177 family)
MPAPEFSRIVDLLPARTAPLRVEATAAPAECQALATRFGQPGITRLTLGGEISWIPATSLYRLDGRIRAQVTQECVVTLEPLEATIDAGFQRLYTPVPPREDRDGADDLDVDTDADDPPDVLTDEQLDIGEVAAEQLALALDPYPRKPGAEMDGAYSSKGTAPEENPFAVLARLKRPD